MSSNDLINTNRRDFLTKTLPACGMMCFASKLAFGSSDNEVELFQQENNPFLEEYPDKITYLDYFNVRYRDFINIFKAIGADIGQENMLEMLKKASAKNNLALGRRLRRRFPDNSFKSFTNIPRDTSDKFRHANIYEIVEDSETAFEMKFSGCLTAKVFLDAKVPDIGYAAVCHADFAFPQGFNPKIKMVRDKTLMEGHDCCNHRYIIGADFT